MKPFLTAAVSTTLLVLVPSLMADGGDYYDDDDYDYDRDDGKTDRSSSRDFCTVLTVCLGHSRYASVLW